MLAGLLENKLVVFLFDFVQIHMFCGLFQKPSNESNKNKTWVTSKARQQFTSGLCDSIVIRNT